MRNSVRYRPHDPHLLWTRRTASIWEGQCDEYGNRRAEEVGGFAADVLYRLPDGLPSVIMALS